MVNYPKQEVSTHGSNAGNAPESKPTIAPIGNDTKSDGPGYFRDPAKDQCSRRSDVMESRIE